MLFCKFSEGPWFAIEISLTQIKLRHSRPLLFWREIAGATVLTVERKLFTASNDINYILLSMEINIYTIKYSMFFLLSIFVGLT